MTEDDCAITRISDTWLERDVDDRRERFCCTVHWKYRSASNVFVEQVIECEYTVDEFVVWILHGHTSSERSRAKKRNHVVGARPGSNKRQKIDKNRCWTHSTCTCRARFVRTDKFGTRSLLVYNRLCGTLLPFSTRICHQMYPIFPTRRWIYARRGVST